MKLNKWLYGVTALAMLAACSDKDITSGGGDNDGNKFIDGVSYLGVSLELPCDPVSRAEEDGDHSNDQFADGYAQEYAVDNAAILLFRGEDEDNAKFVGAYVVENTEKTEVNDNKNITVSLQRTIKVTEKPVLGSKEKLYGLALVNYDPTHFIINTDSKYGNLTIKTPTSSAGEEIKRYKNGPDDAEKFSAFRARTSTCEFIKTKENKRYWFMTNAPLSDSPGTSKDPNGAKIHTLTEFKDNFYKTEVEAKADPAGCMFVERAVAKITCSKFPKSVTFVHTDVDEDIDKNDVTSDIELEIASVEWFVDNEEPSSFLVRNAQNGASFWTLGNKSKYRFIGETGMSDTYYDSDAVHNTNNTYYRTYWCLDPNYNNDDRVYNDQSTRPYKSLIVSGDYYKATETDAFYPHENTFDVKHQRYDNTTRVVFKVKYVRKDDQGNVVNNFNLYAKRDQFHTFYLIDDAQNLLMGTVLRSQDLFKAINELKKDDAGEFKITKSDFTPTFGTASEDDNNHDIKEGEYILTELKLTDAFINKYLDATKVENFDLEDLYDNLINSANMTNNIVPFVDNTCYYPLYIRHFGDTYCPLPDNWKGNTTDEVYEHDDAKKYLGRYGLVRNNWYDIYVDLISNLGKAKVPDGDVPTSDDNKEESWYLSARIHVLSWAKRTQHHQF